MNIFKVRHDGGEKSGVNGLFVIEIKSLFSIVFLKFKKGTREAFHSHAFNAYSWFITGKVEESRLNIETGEVTKKIFKPTLNPKFTPKENVHRVKALTDTWCFTLRGPWNQSWFEYNPSTHEIINLTFGRKILNKFPAKFKRNISHIKSEG